MNGLKTSNFNLRTGQVRSGKVRKGLVGKGQVKTVQIRIGQVGTGPVRTGQLKGPCHRNKFLSSANEVSTGPTCQKVCVCVFVRVVSVFLVVDCNKFLGF